MKALADLVIDKELEEAHAEAVRLGPAAEPELLPLVAHGDPEVRELAVACLGDAGGPAAPLALARALADPELAVASAAVGGLQRLAVPGVAPELLLAFDAAPDWMIRLSIARLLGALEGWEPPGLRQRIAREPHPAVREMMIVALARRGEPEARATFAGWLGEADPEDSPRLARHAWYVSQPWLLRPLLPLLDDWTPAVRNVEGLPGPPHLRVCDVVVNLVCTLADHPFSFPPRPGTNYDLSALEEVKTYLASLPAPAPSPPAP